MITRADADGFAPREEFFTGLRRRLAIDDPVDDLLEEYHVQYPSYFTVEPATVDAIRALRATGVKVGIVTNGPPSQWAKSSDLHRRRIDAVCISAVVGSWKPDIGIFRRRPGRAASRCRAGWWVTQRRPTSSAGRTAGLRTAWMARGREWTRSDHVPDHIVDSIPQAVDVIRYRARRRPAAAGPGADGGGGHVQQWNNERRSVAAELRGEP